MWCYIPADNCGRECCVISSCDWENLWVCLWWCCESASEDRSCELVNAKSSRLMPSQSPRYCKTIQGNKCRSAAALESAGRDEGEKWGGRLRVAPLCQLCGCEKFTPKHGVQACVLFSKFVCDSTSAFPFASCLFCSTLLLSHLASELLWKNMCRGQSDAWCNGDRVQSFSMYVNSRTTIGQAS